MSFPCHEAVDWPYDGLPVGNSIFAGQTQGNDGARAHEISQTGTEELSILVCVEVVALLQT